MGAVPEWVSWQQSGGQGLGLNCDRARDIFFYLETLRNGLCELFERQRFEIARWDGVLISNL